MRQFGGRSYYDTTAELANPSRCALLLVGIQNDHLSQGGYYEKKGRKISITRSVIPKVQKLLSAARESNVMVIYALHSISPGLASDAPSGLSYHVPMGADPSKPNDFLTIEGTWGYKVIDELAPAGADRVLPFNRGDPFIATSLEQVLRSHGKESILFAGTETQATIESASRSAANRDFYRLLVKDCIASTNQEAHDAMFKINMGRVPMATSDEVVAVWKSSLERRVS